MKLKKTTNDLVDSDFELDTGQTFDTKQYQRIRDLYFKEHKQDLSLAGHLVYDRTRILLSATNDIIHSYEITLSIQYDDTGTPIDGGLFLADIYQPPQLNDNICAFSQDFSEIDIDHNVFKTLADKPLLNIHPEEQLLSAEIAPAIFLGSYEDLEYELISQFMDGHHDWMTLMKG